MAVNGISGFQGGAWDWLDKIQNNNGALGRSSSGALGGSDGQGGNGGYAVSGEEEQDGYLAPDEIQKKLTGRKSTPEECETCKNRKYQDGSDEMVSFKSAAHISPSASASRVRAHEQEHVNNAYTKAAKNNGKVLSASVALKTAVCPECGRSYVAGGTTTTQIKYQDESNPYTKNKKSQDAISLIGNHLDIAV